MKKGGVKLSDKEVLDFIHRKDASYQGKLKSHYNYSRVVSLAHFERLVACYGMAGSRVAVVSGTEREPELHLVNPSQVELFNFDPSGDQYNLDKEWVRGGGGFDLVLCNQVIEHIFSPYQAIRNLITLAKPGGYIYITAPTINGIHGEPYFFSAGYHPRMLERLGEEANLEVIDVGCWGSRKYLLNAVIGNWLTWRQLRRFWFLRHHYNIIIPFDILSDGRACSEQVITDSWALFKRPCMGSR